MTKYLFGLRLKDTYDTALLKKNKNIKGIVDKLGMRCVAPCLLTRVRKKG